MLWAFGTPQYASAEPGGLRADVKRIVAAFEAEGWFIDEYRYKDILPIVLESVCRTPATDRGQALRELEAGRRDPEAVYRSEGNNLTKRAQAALTWEREYQALARAVASAEQDCPFWTTPVTGYSGRQTSRNKWVIHLEGGGVGQLLQQQDRLRLGGGGAGRLLLGYGFGDDLSLIAGAELGGGAFLSRDSETSEQGFSIGYLAALPILLRFRDVDWHYDLEIAPVSFLTDFGEPLLFGGRVGGAVGVGVLRRQGLLPWAGIAVAYEQYFADDPTRRMSILRGGLRVGFRWFGFE